MPLKLPNVIVYQEYKEQTVLPATPSLWGLIVGPCYQILDYLDDKADCYGDEYGTLNALTQPTKPFADPAMLTLASSAAVRNSLAIFANPWASALRANIRYLRFAWHSPANASCRWSFTLGILNWLLSFVHSSNRHKQGAWQSGRLVLRTEATCCRSSCPNKAVASTS